MGARRGSPWQGRLLGLAVGLLLLHGQVAASGDGPAPSPLACPAGAVTWLTGSAPPGRALLVRFADAVVGGGSAGSDGRWRIPLSVEAPPGIYEGAVVERQSRSLVAAFTCYVGVPVGATPTGTPTRRPTAHLTATVTAATVTRLPSSPVPTPSWTTLATVSATTAILPSATLGEPTPTRTRIPASVTATRATVLPTSTLTPTGAASVALIAAQADDPSDSELDEHIIVENRSAQPQALLGWRLTHQATSVAYTFPDVMLRADEQLVIWSGAGVDDPGTGTLFWFTTAGRWAAGDVAALFDAGGYLVSSLVVPPPEKAEEEDLRIAGSFDACRGAGWSRQMGRNKPEIGHAEPDPLRSPMPPARAGGHPARAPGKRSPLTTRTIALLHRLGTAPASRTNDGGDRRSADPARSALGDNADLNRIHLTGWLGSEPLLYDIGDHPVATLALASERRWRTAAGVLQLETIWFNLTAWEELAGYCGRVLHQGDRVYVEGALQLWTELRGPTSYACHCIVIDRVVLLAAGAGRARVGDTPSDKDEAWPAT